MPELPTKDEITFRWLIDHVPISWWAIGVAALAAAFSAGIAAGRVSFQNLDGDIREKLSVRDELQSDIQDLDSKKATLNAEITTLQTQRRVQQMSEEQLREALKEWTRD